MTKTKGKRLEVAERRRQLLQFGRKFFASQPFDALPMSEIARKAGVSKGLLYHYFGGRRGFYLATIEDIATEFSAELDPQALQLDEAEPAEVLVLMLRRFVAFGKANEDIYLALVRGGLGSDPDVFAQLEGVRRMLVARLLQLFGQSEPTDLQSTALYGWVCYSENILAEWLVRRGFDESELEPLLVRGFGALGLV